MTSNLTNLQLLELSNDAYNGMSATQKPFESLGYEKVAIDLDAKTTDANGNETKLYDEHFAAAAYYDKTNNKLVVSYAGTDDLSDLFVNDPGYVAGYEIPQFKDAVNFYNAVVEKVSNDHKDITLQNDDITLTGHSHGGGLGEMVGVLKNVEAKVFNAPGIGNQLNNIEEYDNDKGDQIKSGQLTSKDPSLFKVTNIYLNSDAVHLAGNEIGTKVVIDSSNSVFGTALYALLGAAGTALTTGPVGVAYGLLAKFIGSGVSNNHMISGLKEALENQDKINAGHAEETTTAKFLNAVGSINSYIDTGISSVVGAINKTVDWMSSGNVVQDLTGAAKEAWNSTISLFEGLFDDHDGSAPTNSDGTVNTGLIDNSLLNLDIRTDLKSGFLSNNDITQTGNIISGGDYDITAPIDKLNGDGLKNVAPYSIVSDQFRPGNSELSNYANLNTSLKFDLSQIGKINDQISGSSNNPPSQQLNFQLQNPLANLTNSAINAKSFLNIDPVVLDLNGDGVKLTSYNDSEVTFDVDNDGKQERTGWVSKEDGILVDDKNHDGKINNITETISEYYNPNDGSVADADGKYSTDGLAALKKLDSNRDGKFDSQDEKWNDLRIWQDANGNAVTDAGELKTLTEAGVKEINLDNIEIANKERNEGNIIFSKSTYTTTSGESKQVAAVDFTTNPIGYEFNDVNLGKLATAEDGTKSLVIANENGATVIASAETAQNIFGNIGNDKITGDERDNWISGGKGSDTLKGGDGDDVLIIDAEDREWNIDGGNGRDIVIINSDQGVFFNLARANVETVVGGDGDDVLISGGAANTFIDGGSGDDFIIGGAADDALSGSDGNDYIDGGYGDDIIRGHRGQDFLNGGDGDDYLDGGVDNDTIRGGAGNDIMIGGAGNDWIDGGEGYDLAKYQGSYADFDIKKIGSIIKVQDLKTGDVDRISNVDGIRFDDVTLNLSSGNNAPLSVGDTINLLDKNKVFISKNQILANDVDIDGDALEILAVENAIGGTISLVMVGSKITGIEFTPDQSYNGVMSFDYSVMDSKGASTDVVRRNNDGSQVTAPMHSRVEFKLANDPNDALYSKQWYLSEINIKKVWDDYTGEGVKIGIFEKGDFNYTHQDLDDNVLESHKEDQEFRQVEQFSQHKTTVAGVIAAEHNNYGIVGVAYDAKLDGYGWDADKAGLENLKNVDVANNSWGRTGNFGDNFSDPTNFDVGYKNSIESSVKEGRSGLGTINVFAGGNSRAEGDNVNYHNFQNSRFVITTGSVNQPGDLGRLVEAETPFSNPGAAILVSAPGSNIKSTGNALENTNGSTFLGEFSSNQGTSYSAPIVSGVVALMLEANPNLGYRDVQKILALTAREFGDQNTVWQENGAENWNGGSMHTSNDYGYGMVDALAAVRLAETWNETNDFYNEKSFVVESNDVVAINTNTLNKVFTVSNSNLSNIEVVEVALNLSQIDISHLEIILVSPSGTRSILMSHPENSVYSSGLNFNFSSRQFLDEKVDGEWKIEITDSVTGDAGHLNNVKLSFFGKLDDGKSDVYVYTDEFTQLNDASRSILSDNDGGVDTINAAAVSGDSVINLNAGQTSTINGKSLAIGAQTSIENVYSGDGNDTIIGNNSGNILYAGRGHNTLTGNGGSDVFVIKQNLTTQDLITDFTLGEDKIDLSDFDGLKLSDLHFSQSGSDVSIDFSSGQKIFLKNILLDQLLSSESIIINSAPIANNDLASVDEDNAVTIKILDNDHDDKGDLANYNIRILTNPNSGNIAFNSDGSLVYKPNPNFNGTDSFEYSVIDSSGVLSPKAKVSIVVNPISDAPIVVFAITDKSFYATKQIDLKVGNTFVEVDGEKLEYSATLADGSPLPSWLNFDSKHLVFSGIAPSSGLNVGVKLTATDSSGESSSVNFNVIVNNALFGTDGQDTISAGSDDYVIFAGGGDDIVNAGVGHNVIYGGDGKDKIVISRSEGTITEIADFNHEDDVIDIGALNNNPYDKIKDFSDLNLVQEGDDVVISLKASGQVMAGTQSYNLNINQKIILKNTNIDQVTGKNFTGITDKASSTQDLYVNYSDFGGDKIITGSGNDTIVMDGFGGNTIRSGAGDDKIYLHTGNNTIKTGSGNDTIFLSSRVFSGNDIIEDFDLVNDKIDISDLFYLVGKKFSDLTISQQGSDVVLSGLSRATFAIRTLTFKNTHLSDISEKNFIGINANPTESDDIIYGTSSSDNINSLAGNDAIKGGDGDDVLNGGDGNDNIDGGSGADTLYGDAGSDQINGSDGNDQIFGGLGNDTLNGGNGDDVINGGDGSDKIYGNSGVNILSGGDGSDIFFIENGSGITDTITDFSAVNGDQIDVSSLSDVGSFATLKILQQGQDTLITISSDQQILLKNVNASDLKESSFNGLKKDIVINGSKFDDILSVGYDYAGIQSTLVDGKAGNDTIYGSSQDDVILGGDGNDSIIGGGGNDTISGNTGSDKFVFQNTYSYSDSTTVVTDFEIGSDKIKFDGVTGINGFGDLSISDGIDGAVISFQGTNSWSSTVTNNQIVVKSISASQIGINDFEFKNTVNGTSGSDNIIASDQDNYIYGNGGDDIINAGDGDDEIRLSSGQNTAYAGEGNDVFSVYDDFYNQNSTPTGGKLFGEEGDDEFFVYGKGKYELSGGSGNDYFDVSVLDSAIDGGGGDDNIVLSTINGYDYISQTNFVVGGGNAVHGGSGNDTIEIYSGNGNTIYGDDGVDKFIIDYSPNSVTTIADFDLNEKIDLQNMDVKSMSDLEISQSGSDLLIKFKDNQSVLLKNISQLSEQNIIFKVSGTSGNDVIQNASGDSIMSGGGGSDTFVISKDPNSQKEIVDFDYNNPNEKIQLKGFSEIKDFSDISIQYQESGFLGVVNNVPVYSYDAHVNLGDGQTIVIKNAPKDSIKLDSFVFYQNSDPVATDINSTVSEDGFVIIDLLAQASDIDGDTLSVQITNPTNGTAEFIGNGRIKYTPNHNYNGNDSFEYKLSDSNGGFVSKAVNLNISSVNDALTIKSAISNSVVDEDVVNTVLTAAVVSNAFSDIDGDVLTYEALLSNGDPLPSWLAINSTTGEITSTNPSNNQVGNHEIIITATDSSGASVSQNFVVTVNNINDAPTASLVISSGNEDSGQITLAFNGNDVDASDVLNYNILSNPSFGSIVNNNNGTFTFNLGNDFQNLGVGQTTDVSFTYLATDSSGVQSNIATATITITGTNDAPTASITSIATNEDNSVKIDVLAGASDADAGDALSLISVTHGSHGTASIATDANGNKVISYVPSTNYNGSDVITYTISDNNGATVTKELTVTVNAINDAPIIVSDAQNQAAESGKAFTYALPSNLFSDIDGDSLTINATLADGSALPSWLSFDGSKFSGTPNVSSATNLSIKLTATDSSGASVSQNFGINVTNPNNAPIAKDDAFALNEDASLTISFASILKNDSDVEDKTNIQKLTKDNIIFNNPGNGTITVTDTGIIYKPNKDFNGNDSLTYQIKDSSGALSNSATINLTVKPVNDAPVVASDLFVTDEDTSIIIKLSDLLVNDFDAEDGAAIQNLTLDKFVFSNPGKGTIVKDAVNNTIIYTPNKNYNGTDSLTYQIKDSNGALSNKVKINLSINAVNDGPIATNDSFTTNEDRVITINFSSILRNDSDVEDGVNIKQITKDNIVFGDPVNGKITITDTGIIYAPNKDFNGSDSLTYQIKDSNGTLSNIANINLTIKAINDAPVAASDSFVTSEDSSLIIKLSDLLANDFDVEDGQAIQDLTLDRLVFSNPAKGKIVKDVVNNTIIYTPNKDYNGSDSLTYQIKDSNGTLSNKATISLTVEAVNDAPVAGTKLADKSVKAGNLFSYTLPVKAFTDVDKDVLTYSAKLADDSELPSWLKFDNATKTFSGTSPSGTASTLLIKVTANDGSLDASQSFLLKITSNLTNGTSGNNTLNGTSLNDEIYGNDGIDNIKGNAGNDLIIGGKGADVLLGGAGNDQFIFSNLTDSTINESDLILDFIKGEDKINLSGLGFEDITNQSGSTHSAHGLEYYFDGKNTVIDDPNSNFAVKLAGDISLDHNDFAF